jgi:hypothetical protein
MSVDDPLTEHLGRSIVGAVVERARCRPTTPHHDPSGRVVCWPSANQAQHGAPRQISHRTLVTGRSDYYAGLLGVSSQLPEWRASTTRAAATADPLWKISRRLGDRGRGHLCWMPSCPQRIALAGPTLSARYRSRGDGRPSAGCGRYPRSCPWAAHSCSSDTRQKSWPCAGGARPGRECRTLWAFCSRVIAWMKGAGLVTGIVTAVPAGPSAEVAAQQAARPKRRHPRNGRHG